MSWTLVFITFYFFMAGLMSGYSCGWNRGFEDAKKIYKPHIEELMGIWRK